MKRMLTALAVVISAVAVLSVRAVSLETVDLRVEFDNRTGSLISVFDKASNRSFLEGKGEDLWKLHWMDEASVGSTDCATNGAGVKVEEKEGCVRLSWENEDVRVMVQATAVGNDIDLSAGLVSKRGDAGKFEFPINLHFDPGQLKRMVFPGGPHSGLGFSFHGEFFTKRKSVKPGESDYWWHGDYYPNCHADFWALDFKDGTSLSGYGVQPRAEHDPWKAPIHFMRTGLGAGGTQRGGRINHLYHPFAKRGIAVRLPTFRLSAKKGLQSQLDDYARANGIGKRLSQKVSSDVLEKLLHGPMVLIGGSSKEVESCLPYLTAPALIHAKHYMAGGFDRRYPDILPPNDHFGGSEGFAKLTKAIQSRGMLFMPYSNPTWWAEPKGPTFLATGDAALWRSYDGQVHHEVYDRGTSGWRTTLWHPAVRKVNRENVLAFKEKYGIDVLFQDQVGGRSEHYDFNPSSPSVTSYVEGLLSMAEEDARDLPLACEDGWDKIADIETAMFGGCWKMFPVDVKNPDAHPDMKRKWPADLWEYEPVFPRLMKGNVLFYMHNLGQFVRNDRVLAWHVAYAYCLNATYHYNVFFTDNPHSRWYKRLCAVQREVISQIAAQPVVSFVHDRKPMLSRDDIPHDWPYDDGIVIAQYGRTKVYVNLGDITRPVGPHGLGPYGWIAVLPDGRIVKSIDFIEQKGKK